MWKGLKITIMAAKTKVKSGDRYGNLVIVKEIEPHTTPCGTIRRRFLCKCDCGNTTTRTLVNLNKDNFHSCGCVDRKRIGNLNRKYTDEQRKSFLYSTWNGMRQRCLDSKSSHYKYYGERGITICDEWMNDYTKFYDWCIANGATEELTIDRIDVNGNYEPNNCRWVDTITQANNKNQNRFIEYNGEKLTIMQWSRKTGIKEATIRMRLDKYGYNVGEALGYEMHKTKQYNRENRRKPVEQYSLNGKFIKLWDSAQVASVSLGISIQSIRNCAIGVYKTGNGFIWKYKQKND